MDITFEEMVNRLCKPATELNFTADQLHRVHMVMGICGEVGELVSAIGNDDTDNIIEEMGDLEFYYTGIAQSYGFEFDHIETNESARCPFAATDILLIRSAELCDVVKKQVIYNKPIDTASVHAAVKALRVALSDMYFQLDVKREEVISHNMAKLEKRYPGFNYSDHAANTRADKA